MLPAFNSLLLLLNFLKLCFCCDIPVVGLSFSGCTKVVQCCRYFLWIPITQHLFSAKEAMICSGKINELSIFLQDNKSWQQWKRVCKCGSQNCQVFGLLHNVYDHSCPTAQTQCLTAICLHKWPVVVALSHQEPCRAYWAGTQRVCSQWCISGRRESGKSSKRRQRWLQELKWAPYRLWSFLPRWS